jgi:hypothetical protein
MPNACHRHAAEHTASFCTVGLSQSESANVCKKMASEKLTQCVRRDEKVRRKALKNTRTARNMVAVAS